MFRVAEPLGLDREPRGLGLLGAERLHHDDPVDALVDHVRDVADEALCARRRSFGAALVHDVERGDGREEQEGDDTEHPVGREHPHRRDHDEHHGAAHVGQGTEHLRRGLGVGLHVREQLARRVGLEVRERLVLVAVDHSLAEDRGDAHLCASRVHTAQHHSGGAHRADDDQRDDASDERVDLDLAVGEAGRDDVIDDPAEHERLGDRTEREDRCTAHRDRERLALERDMASHHLPRRAAPSHR